VFSPSYQCDLCGKNITTAQDAVKVGYQSYGFWALALCADCGKPAIQLLKCIEKKLKNTRTHATSL
jgi:hypothetical protein